jgi:hypothetical protein
MADADAAVKDATDATTSATSYCSGDLPQQLRRLAETCGTPDFKWPASGRLQAGMGGGFELTWGAG